MGGWLKGIGIDVWMEDGDRSKWTDGGGRDGQTGKRVVRQKRQKHGQTEGDMNGRTERVTGMGNQLEERGTNGWLGKRRR